MDFPKLNAKLITVLSSLSRTERRFIRVVAILAAVVSTALVTLQYIELTQLRPVEVQSWGMTSYDLTDFWLRLRIAVALVVNLVCIYRFRPKGFLVSALALLWVVIEFILWFESSLRLKEALDIGHLPEPSILGFYNAVWWDLVVLCSTMMLLAWAIKTLVLILRSSPDHPEKRCDSPQPASRSGVEI